MTKHVVLLAACRLDPCRPGARRYGRDDPAAGERVSLGPARCAPVSAPAAQPPSWIPAASRVGAGDGTGVELRLDDCSAALGR